MFGAISQRVKTPARSSWANSTSADVRQKQRKWSRPFIACLGLAILAVAVCSQVLPRAAPVPVKLLSANGPTFRSTLPTHAKTALTLRSEDFTASRTATSLEGNPEPRVLQTDTEQSVGLRRAAAPLLETQRSSVSQLVSPADSTDAPEGDAACSSPCGAHGKCVDAVCQCAVAFEGPTCEAKLLPLPDVASGRSFGFQGQYVQNQAGMAGRKRLELQLPHKGRDPDHGHRVLAEGADFKALVGMLPRTDDVLGATIFDSCAIVGSSGIMRSFRHGAEIDSHEMVMRFNSAATKGFEEFVGTKTTHRITNTQNWGFHESDEEAILVHFRAPSAVKGIHWHAKQRSKLRLYAFDPNWVEFMAKTFNFLATSGLYGIMLALQRCRHVDLYGFQVSEAQGVLYHYYNVCDVPANIVRDDAEFQVVKFLATQQLVRLREPCIIECHGTKAECAACKTAAAFPATVKPSTAHCDPRRVSHGHHKAPWAR